MTIHIVSVYDAHMNTATVSTHERVNITLPKDTLRLIDRVTKKTNRSRFLDCAVHFYIAKIGRTNLKTRLRAGAVARRDSDEAIAEEWFPVEASI